ncbi:unnamed protein product [Porites lobata]|uniref:Ion transport domain-containing protein n=1 Tax=Porites lobata TaxID=104759 RepID=A0ABN8NXS3_9CNID|nr:unnamed protein product [Porites lobata]
MVLRVLRLVKIIGQIKRFVGFLFENFQLFQVVVGTVMQIGPAMGTYGAIMFVLYYMYAILGMELFGGLIKSEGSYPSSDSNGTSEENVTEFCGNIKLNGSDFYADRYCNNNFNDILRSFKVLFDLMVVNQWHIITQGYVRVTNKFARIYFLSFHLFCVIVVLNIFVAFILEAFMLEYSFTHGKIETVFNKKIQEKGIGVGIVATLSRHCFEWLQHCSSIATLWGAKNRLCESNGFTSVEHLALDTGLRFKMPSQQKKNADLLLQEMFEDELEEDDIGPKDVEDLDELDESEDIIEAQSKRRLTFHTVDAE